MTSHLKKIATLKTQFRYVEDHINLNKTAIEYATASGDTESATGLATINTNLQKRLESISREIKKLEAQ